MSFVPPPADAPPSLLARRLADYVVLNTSPDVPEAAADYWELSVAAYRTIEAVTERTVADAPELAAAHRRLARHPDSLVHYRAFVDGVQQLLEGRPEVRDSVLAALVRTDPTIWIDHWQGDRHVIGPSHYDVERLSVPDLAPRTADRAVGIHIVIPFRGAVRGERTRNLLACLRALRDQDPPEGGATVTVVETDDEPRVRDLVRPFADRHVFGYKSGLFNKSWAVNLGLRSAGEPDAPGTPELTCVLDADILVERSFLASNQARFVAGHDAHLPFQHMLFLDGPSSHLAIHSRLTLREPAADIETLRGLSLREVPGACLWARTGVLHRVGGFDERYEGWGGEDDDIVGRLSRFASFTRFDDPMIHLHHPRPQMVREDGTALNGHLVDSHRGTDAWDGTRGWGQPDQFAEPQTGRATA